MFFMTNGPTLRERENHSVLLLGLLNHSSHSSSPIRDDGASITPLSETLSNSSSLVHFKTSMDLRDNEPEHHSRRKLSNATLSSEIPEPEPHHSDLAPRLTPEFAYTVVNEREPPSSSQPPTISEPTQKFKKKQAKKSDKNAGKTLPD